MTRYNIFPVKHKKSIRNNTKMLGKNTEITFISQIIALLMSKFSFVAIHNSIYREINILSTIT